jgi:hypothetical protein
MAALVVPGFTHDIDGTFCGGTVIAPYAILTAAHCIIQQQAAPPAPPVIFTPNDFVVVTGAQDLGGNLGQHIAVRAIVTHPQFVQTSSVLDKDLAVVLLRTPTSAAGTARSTTTPTSGPATVYGWGGTDGAGTIFPPTLKTATLAIQPAGDCGAAFPSSICAGLTTPNVCIGDSGGPFLVSTPAGRRLAGVISGILSPMGGPTTCGADSSGFTDVSLFAAWIDAQLKPELTGVHASIVNGNVRVTWTAIPGGAAPSATIFTSNDPLHPRATAAGATSLDVGGLPVHTPLTFSVRVQNAWGTSQMSVPGSFTLTGPPGISAAALAKSAIGAQIVTNGAAVTVKAQYGLDTVHLTTTPGVQLADAAAAQEVSIPLAGLLPARTYRVRLVAQSAGGTTASAFLTLTTPAVKPVSKAKPKLRGTARVGRTVTCTSGTWLGAPAPKLTYRWRIGTRVSSRYRSSRLKLASSMRGRKVACVVTARNAAGSVTARSPAVTVRRR